MVVGCVLALISLIATFNANTFGLFRLASQFANKLRQESLNQSALTLVSSVTPRA